MYIYDVEKRCFLHFKWKLGDVFFSSLTSPLTRSALSASNQCPERCPGSARRSESRVERDSKQGGPLWGRQPKFIDDSYSFLMCQDVKLKLFVFNAGFEPPAGRHGRDKPVTVPLLLWHSSPGASVPQLHCEFIYGVCFSPLN